MTDLTNSLGLDPEITSVSFHQLPNSIFSASRLGTVIGIWESDVIDGSSTLLAWKEVTFSGTKPQGGDIYLFISNMDSVDEDPVWSGPYRNSETSIISLEKRYIKIRAVLKQAGEVTQGYDYQSVPLGPFLDYIILKGIASGTASKFFTDALDIGFSPKHILITAQTDIPEGSLIRFGVTNIDSTDLSLYQFVDLDTITKLNRLPVTGESIKIYIEMSGNSGETITVHEFATMFSGQEQSEINR